MQLTARDRQMSSQTPNDGGFEHPVGSSAAGPDPLASPAQPAQTSGFSSPTPDAWSQPTPDTWSRPAGESAIASTGSAAGAWSPQHAPQPATFGPAAGEPRNAQPEHPGLASQPTTSFGGAGQSPSSQVPASPPPSGQYPSGPGQYPPGQYQSGPGQFQPGPGQFQPGQ